MPEPGLMMLPEATTVPVDCTDPDVVPDPCTVPELMIPEPGRIVPDEKDPADEIPDASPLDDPLEGIDPVDAPEPLTEKACPPQ